VVFHAAFTGCRSLSSAKRWNAPEDANIPGQQISALPGPAIAQRGAGRGTVRKLQRIDQTFDARRN
jgi:hypothetical protein